MRDTEGARGLAQTALSRERRAAGRTDINDTPNAVAAAPADQEARILGLTSLGHLLCHVGELLFAGVLTALMAEFDLPPDRAALLGLPGLILFGIGALPAGLGADRWGARGVLIAYFFGTALMAAAVALAPNWWTVALTLTGLGAALSLYHPAGLALLTHGCRRRGRALGINGVAGSVGVALGPALGKYLAYLGHWRAAYVILAAACSLAGLAMVLLPIDEPAARQARARWAGREEGEPDGRSAAGLWLLFGAMMLGGLNYRTLLTALPNYLGGGASSSGLLASGALVILLVLALGGVGQYLGGHLADRVQTTRLYVGLIAATVPLALVLAHTDSAIGMFAAAGIALCLFGQQPVENTLMARITPPRRRSTLFGVKFMLTFGVGALGAELVGIIWKRTGSPAAAFDGFAASALVMATLAVCFRRARLSETPALPADTKTRGSSSPFPAAEPEEALR